MRVGLVSGVSWSVQDIRGLAPAACRRTFSSHDDSLEAGLGGRLRATQAPGALALVGTPESAAQDRGGDRRGLPDAPVDLRHGVARLPGGGTLLCPKGRSRWPAPLRLRDAVCERQRQAPPSLGTPPMAGPISRGWHWAGADRSFLQDPRYTWLDRRARRRSPDALLGFARQPCRGRRVRKLGAEPPHRLLLQPASTIGRSRRFNTPRYSGAGD